MFPRLIAATSLAIMASCTALLGVEDLEVAPPALASLEVDVGTLVPSFDPDIDAYEVLLPVAADSVTVSAVPGVGVNEVVFDNEPFAGSVSLALELGPATSTLEVIRTDGVSKTVSITFVRGAVWQQTSVVKGVTVPGALLGSELDFDGTTMVATNTTEPDREGASIFRLVSGQWVIEPVAPKPACPEVPGSGQFGAGVGVKGSTMVIGAPLCADSQGSMAGLAQHLERNANGGWPSAGILRDGQDPQGPNRFGNAVALGDGVLAVGRAPTVQPGLIAILFQDDGAGGWSVIAGFPDTFGTNSDPVIIDADGSTFAIGRGNTFAVVETQPTLQTVTTVNAGANISSLSMSGDVIAVGLASDASGRGTVQLYRRSGATAALEAELVSSNSEAGDQFGVSVATDGNILVVGASGEAGGGSGVGADPNTNDLPGSGAAYVFVRRGTQWLEVRYIKAANPDAQDAFGHRVALHENSFLIAAPGEDSSTDPLANDAIDSGAVYYFE